MICTDNAFIDSWNRNKSAVMVARELGMSERNAHNRRRTLERTHGIVLEASNGMAWRMREQDFIQHKLVHGRVLISSDIHVWPEVDTTAMVAFVLACEYMMPDVVCLNGDVFDGATISRFGESEWNHKPTPAQELAACKKYVSDVATAARKSNPKVKLVWVMGNHDCRFLRKLIELVPMYRGVPGLDFRDHFPEWEFCYRLTINEGTPGHTDIVHNWGGGAQAAYSNVMRSGVNYVTGHTHRNLTRPWRDRTGQRYGVETGTGIDIDGPQTCYVAGRPVDWHPGFPLLTFHKGSLLRPEHVDVIGEGQISFRGQVVDVDILGEKPVFH